MKVLIILLIACVAAICAMPMEKSDNQNLITLSNLEAAPADADIDFINELVRDKRQYGGTRYPCSING